ncbi:hypothetical protein DRH13_02400 [Candidatus Woesebacteria bacterium]|nr:MAG: hypothetical protein DRH13_02400 [Candidatus Woesebacteria bacterium]
MSLEQKEQKRWEREGVVFFVYKGGKVLVEQRPDSDPGYGGYIVIPGGKCEGLETPEQALLRETEEELGIKPLSWIHLDTFEHVTLDGRHYLSHAYLISEFEEEVQNKETYKGKQMWVSLDEAGNFLKLGPSRLILFKAKEAILAEQKKD